MRLQNPFSALSTTGLDSQVLSVLARTDQPLNVSQVHALLPEQGSLQGVRNSLERLSDEGVVDEMSIGRSFGYSLNRDHLLSGAISQIAGVKRLLISRIAEAVERWAIQPVTVKLFGSAARNEMQTGSDIDLLFVMPDEVSGDEIDALVAQLAHDISRWTGNDVRPLVYRSGEVFPAEIFSSILRDGIDVSGDPGWLRRHATVKKAS